MKTSQETVGLSYQSNAEQVAGTNRSSLSVGIMNKDTSR